MSRVFVIFAILFVFGNAGAQPAPTAEPAAAETRRCPETTFEWIIALAEIEAHPKGWTTISYWDNISSQYSGGPKGWTIWCTTETEEEFPGWEATNLPNAPQSGEYWIVLPSGGEECIVGGFTQDLPGNRKIIGVAAGAAGLFLECSGLEPEHLLELSF